MMNAIVDKFIAEAVRVVAPCRCHWCATPLGAGVACASCRATLPWNDRACRHCALPLAATALDACANCLRLPPPQDRTWTAFHYAAPVSHDIIALKFHARFASAHALGELMAARLALRPEPLPEWLVPVPLHASRLRLRGYNQALELARALAARLPLRLAPAVARRLRATPEQTRLSSAQRRRNLRGAFAVDAEVRGRHVALLDDVVTTGATAAELARAMRAAGAARVEVWAAARAL